MTTTVRPVRRAVSDVARGDRGAEAPTPVTAAAVPSALQLNLPKAWARFADVTAGRWLTAGPQTSPPSSHCAVLGLHAPLPARQLEVALALALGETCKGDAVVLVPEPRFGHANMLVRSWLKGAHSAKVSVLGSYTCVERDSRSSRLWITTHDADPATAPFGGVRSWWMVDAQLRAQDLWAAWSTRVSGIPVYTASPAARGHWIQALRRKLEATGGVVLVQGDELASSFGDLEPLVSKERNGPRWRSDYLLEEAAQERQGSLLRFARRLKVRTEKKDSFLADSQVEEARRIFGEGWRSPKIAPLVSFVPSALQRKYYARKRLARKLGYNKVLVLKPRREGITTFEQMESYETVTNNPRSFVTTLAHTHPSAQRIFRIAKTFHETDPKAVPTIKDSATQLELANGSLFFVGTAGGSGANRGDSLQRVQVSETPYCCQGPRQFELMDTLIASLMGTAPLADIVLEGTPNGREWYHAQWVEAREGRSDWYPIMLRWFDDPTNKLRVDQFIEAEILETLDDEEKSLIERYHLKPAQLAWRRSKKAEFKHLFYQEFPEDDETCFLSVGFCYFDVPLITEMLRALPQYEVEHVEGGYIKRWKPPVKGRRYVIGVDTSEGLPGCDPNGAGVLDFESGEQVASAHGLFGFKRLAKIVYDLHLEYNGAMVGIERENHGHAVLQAAADLGLAIPHHHGGPVYYFTPARERGKSRDDVGKRAGWSTNPATRPVMLAELQEATHTGAMVVNDRTYFGECLSFRLQSDGQYRADSNAHDDSIMKWAIAWQMRKVPRPRPSIVVLEGSIG